MSSPITPVALVTGGARRVGEAIVRRLAADGRDVVIHHHRSARDAEALANDVRAMGTGAWTLRADLRDEREAARVVPEAANLAGRPIGLLVNNASDFPSSRAFDATPAAIDESMRVHHHAPLLMARALADQAREACIVNVLDATRPEDDAAHFAYQTGKSALRTLTRQLACALAPQIRVNAVSPGAVLEPEMEAHERLHDIARRLPLRMHGAPEDVADAVAFLADARFVTGVELHVDGGAHLLARGAVA